MTFDKRLIGALRACWRTEIIEDTFKCFGVDEMDEKIAYLLLSIDNSKKSVEKAESSDNMLDAAYAVILQMFLAGNWKTYEILETIGIFKKKKEDNPIFEELKLCKDQEMLDKTFLKHGIKSLTDRIEIMRDCMGVLSVSEGVPKDTSIEDDYRFECEVFLMYLNRSPM